MSILSSVRYPKEHKEETRARILAAAGRLLREGGYAATGVADLMNASHLTVGAFYAHFDSKEALFSEVVARSLDGIADSLLKGLDDTRGFPFVREIARRYLSRAHRDAPADGCALPALAPEVGRAGEATRAMFERHVEALLETFEPHMPADRGHGLGRKDRAIALAALCIGGMTLARAVKSKELSDRILSACKRFATADAGDET
jgi:TetR/AcrR family transcriptional repressor of nem operon